MVKKTTMITGYIYIYTYRYIYECALSDEHAARAGRLLRAGRTARVARLLRAGSLPHRLQECLRPSSLRMPPAEPEPDDELLWAELMAIELSVGRLNVGGEVHART